MNEKYPCKFTAEELAERSKGRLFDQILVVVKDLDTKIERLENIFNLTKWTEKGVWSDVYQGRCASAWMREIELKFVEPGDAATPWKTFADRYGEGICCVREVIPADKWDAELERITALKAAPAAFLEDETGITAVFDFIDWIGGHFAIHKNSEDRKLPANKDRNDRKLCQINVTTDDVERTIAQLTQIVEGGPWSIGSLNNKTIANAGVLVDGKLTEPEFWFQLGITLVGNIEFEVIEPVKGPTCYRKSIDKRGVGYHHIKEIVPPEKMEAEAEQYAAKGMPLVIKGTVDITSFAYIDSEDAFSFYVEYGDGLPPNALPDGYDEYIYP